MAGKKRNHKEKKAVNTKKRNFSLIMLFVLAILFSVVLTEIAYFLYKIQYVKIINAKFETANTIGFALGKEELDFGIIPSGGSATRYIDVENQGTRSVILEIITTGKLRDFVYYENYILFQQNETKRLSFEVFVPATMQTGKYTGKIFLIFKRA